MALFTGMVLQVENQTEIYGQSLDIQWPDSSTDVESVTHGNVGTAPGPDQCMINASNAVLAAHARFDWQKAWRDKAEVNVRCFQLGDDRVLEGTFMVREVSLGTGAPGSPTLESLRLASVGAPAPIFE